MGEALVIILKYFKGLLKLRFSDMTGFKVWVCVTTAL